MTQFQTVELTTYFEFIGVDAIRLKGHRIGIEHILERYLVGFNPDEIAQEFPGLALEKIYATITYYLANREEVNAYLQRRRLKNIEAYRDWAAEPSPLIQRLRTIRDADEGV